MKDEYPEIRAERPADPWLGLKRFVTGLGNRKRGTRRLPPGFENEGPAAPEWEEMVRRGASNAIAPEEVDGPEGHA